MDAFGKLCSIEVHETKSTLIDLNEQMKAKRIVSFAQRLIKRLLARGIAVPADIYEFPLNHSDIADATGLTPTTSPARRKTCGTMASSICLMTDL